MTPLADLRAVFDDLNTRYCRSIDEDRLEDWPRYFTEDGRYEINARENHLQGLPVGMMFCDSRGMMQDRVTAVRKVLVFEPHVYRHITSGALIDAPAQGRFSVSSSFVVFRISAASGESIVYASGSYNDDVVVSETGPLFSRRLVLLDSIRLQTGLVIPL